MGKCIIFSAPSGAGKTTIVQHLLQKELNLSFSISACTRAKRGKEIDGKDYYFLSQEEFDKKKEKGEFIEWEEVYPEHSYGTLKSEINRIWDKNEHVIFDVDVVGGLQLKSYFGEKALSVFVMPPSLASLETRLRGRKTETDEKIKYRLAKAEEEMATASQFDFILLNDDLEIACEKAHSTIKHFLKA